MPIGQTHNLTSIGIDDVFYQAPAPLRKANDVDLSRLYQFGES